MQAADLMTRAPAFVLPTERVGRAAEIMRDLGVGAVPVVADVESMRLVGIITDRDLAIRCVARGHAGPCHVEEHMTRPPLATVPESAPVSAVLQRMEKAGVRRLPVVSGADGALVGIIAQADLALHLGPVQPLKVEHFVEAVSQPVRRSGAPARETVPSRGHH